MSENYIMKLKLTNFINSRVMEIENDDGVLEKGVFIPTDINDIFVTSRNQAIAWLFVNERRSDFGDGYSHYLKLKTSKQHLEKMNELGYETPFIGGMKKSFFKNRFQETSVTNARVKNIVYE